MLAMMLATIGRPHLILTNWARQCRRLHEVRPPTFAFWSSPPSRSSSASSRWSSPSSRSSSASSRWASLWSSSSIFWCDWSLKIHEPAGLKNCGWYSHCKVPKIDWFFASARAACAKKPPEALIQLAPWCLFRFSLVLINWKVREETDQDLKSVFDAVAIPVVVKTFKRSTAKRVQPAMY